MNRKITLPIAKAQELAKSFGDDFLAAVLAALNSGLDAVNVEATPTGDGSYDLSVTEPDGVMVALMVPDWLQSAVAVPGGEAPGDLHVTLAYLGYAADLSLEEQRRLVGVVGEVVMRSRKLKGVLSGLGRFSNDGETDPLWVGVDVPGLTELQADLASALEAAGFTVSSHGEYTPHVTVAWIDPEAPLPELEFAPLEVCFENVTVAVGGRRLALDLPGEDEYEMVEDAPRGWVPAAINKSIETVEEDRYTLAPFYIPGTLDAHNEHTDTREIEKAFWKYMSKADPNIRLQHGPAHIVAGERVDGVVWPFEVTVPLTKADGTQTEYTFPAGTPWLGVKWEPWAWELIQEGKINGYSMGGSATMLEVDLEGGAEAHARAAE